MFKLCTKCISGNNENTIPDSTPSKQRTGPSHIKKIICQVNTKSMYDSSNLDFQIEHVDLNLCTHLVCIDKCWNDAEEPWRVDDPHRGADYEQLTGLRAKYPHLKVLLGIRLYNRDFIEIVKDNTICQMFIGNASNFLSRYEFDGVNLTWNYSSEDDPKFITDLRSLFQLLNAKLKESNRLFTSTCSILQGSDIEWIKLTGILKIPDFTATFHSYPHLNDTNDALMAYSFSKFTENFDDLLRIFNTHQQIERYKIVVGFDFDGPEFITSNDATKLNGFVDYNTICGLLSTENWQNSIDDKSGVAIAKCKTNERNEEISIVFESSRFIANAIKYAMNRNFGGAMTGLLQKDCVRGKCDFDANTWADFKPAAGINLNIPQRNDSTFPLLKTINEAIEVTLDESYQQEFIDAH